jgi:hypothetical protein
MEQLKILHAGCGDSPLPRDWQSFRETRLDSDPEVNPDVLASIVAMPMIEDESFDAVLASHVVEHLYAHEAAMALTEFHRVLKPGGIMEVWVPDLQTIGGRLGLDQLDVPFYLCSMGPITPLDMIYGHRPGVANGKKGMAHKTGFTASVLKAACQRAGFTKILIEREGAELKAKAIKSERAKGGDVPSQHDPKHNGECFTPTSEPPGSDSGDTTSTTRASCQPV